MIHWKRQNQALVGEVRLSTGGQGTVVLVDSGSNPAGAFLLVPSASGQKETVLFPAAGDWISAENFIDVLAAQQRVFAVGNFPLLEV